MNESRKKTDAGSPPSAQDQTCSVDMRQQPVRTPSGRLRMKLEGKGGIADHVADVHQAVMAGPETMEAKDRIPESQQAEYGAENPEDSTGYHAVDQFHAFGVQLSQRVGKIRLLTRNEEEWHHFVSGLSDSLMGRIEVEEQAFLLRKYENSLSSLVEVRSRSYSTYNAGAIVAGTKLSELEEGKNMGPSMSSSSSLNCSEDDLATIRLLASTASSSGGTSSSTRSAETRGAYRISPFDSSNLAPAADEDGSISEPRVSLKPDIAVEAELIADGNEEERAKGEVAVAVATATRMTLLSHLREPKVCGLICFLIIAVIVASVVATTRNQQSADKVDASLSVEGDDEIGCDLRGELISRLAPSTDEYGLDAPNSQEALEWLIEVLEQEDTCLIFTNTSSLLQRYALAAVFFSSTMGQTLTESNFCDGSDSAGWPLSENQSDEYCSWAGVYCQNGAVAALDLSRRGWSGALPGELVLLNNSLAYLDLSFNDYSGSIPSLIGELTKIETLDLSANRLTGEIPSSIGAMKMATAIFMEENSFIGTVPNALCDLNLEQLTVGCCASCSCCSYCPAQNLSIPFASFWQRGLSQQV